MRDGQSVRPEGVVAAASWVGADAAVAEQILASPHRRPFAYVQDHRISVVALATVEPATGQPADDFAGHEVHLHGGSHGLVVVCPELLATVPGEVVSGVHGGPLDALLAILLALADRPLVVAAATWVGARRLSGR